MGYNVENLASVSNIESSTFRDEVLPEILERANRISEARSIEDATTIAEDDLDKFETSLRTLEKDIFSGKRHEYEVAAKAHLAEIDTMPVGEIVSMISNQANATLNWFKKRLKYETNAEKEKNTAELSRDLAKRQNDLQRFIDETNEDPKLMFQALFDEQPKGEISFEQNPISIIIYIESEEDFNKVTEIDYRTGQKRNVTLAGAAINIKGTRDKSLSGAVIAVSMERAKQLPQSLDSVIDHEKQHALRQFMEQKTVREINDIYDVIDELGVFEIIGQVPENEKADFAKDYLRFLVDLSIEFGVKDEILAYYRCGVPVAYTEAFLKSGGNYFDFDKLATINAFTEQGIHKEVAENIVETVLTSEYDEKIHNAVLLVDSIRINHGYSRQETATKLTGKSINEWQQALG